MTVETAADRASLLADFGQAVTFSPGNTYPKRNDNTREIIAIFDNGFLSVIGEQTVLNQSTPQIMAASADLVNAKRNSMVELYTGDVYKVVSVEPDGTGITTLLLEGPK